MIMEDLKKIWHKLNDLQVEIEQVLNKDAVENTYKKLKKEADLQKKWMPWMIPYIFCLMALMTWLTQAHDSFVKMSGIALITIGGLVMTYLLQANKIPIEQYQHHQDATTFMKIVKEKLEKRKHFWAIGVAIYTLSLTFGLHLLIFGLDSLAGKGGYVGLLYGMMLGLTGFATGNMYLAHQKQYGEVLKTVNRFLAT